MDGNVYQLTAGAPVALRAGMTVSAKSAVRTAKDSGALMMMDDGSRIEMRDRTELTVANRRDGSTVQLGGGAIIVEASPQGSGHLDVRTSDCLVAVKGTIFAVNTRHEGLARLGRRGAVRVAADGRESLLKPGDQMTTSGAVQTVAVGDEIAWSKDSARYVQLLNELASLRKDLDARVHDPALRYGSRLLDRLPKGTILYAAIPNLTEALLTAKTVFEEHVAQSGALQSWWNEHMSSPEHRKNMDEAFEKVKVLGSQLGDEIVIALVQSADGGVRGPILVAEVKDRSEFRRTLVKEMRDIQGPKPEASVKFDGSIVRIECARHLDSGTSTAATAEAPAWEDSPFRSQAGRGVRGRHLVAVRRRSQGDARPRGRRGSQRRFAPFRRTVNGGRAWGFYDAEYLIFERTATADGANLHAEISFDQPRRGFAGWLAAPAPMGAAEFVSPDAAFAAAAAVKRPEVLLAEALSWIGPNTESHVIDSDLESVARSGRDARRRRRHRAGWAGSPDPVVEGGDRGLRPRAVPDRVREPGVHDQRAPRGRRARRPPGGRIRQTPGTGPTGSCVTQVLKPSPERAPCATRSWTGT